MGVIFLGCFTRLPNLLLILACKYKRQRFQPTGERVVDVFYVKDIFGLQIQNEVRQQTIRNRLLEIFVDTDEAVNDWRTR